MPSLRVAARTPAGYRRRGQCMVEISWLGGNMSNSILFRELGDVEIAEFKAYARENHKAGDPIEREIWHPVIVKECELIDREAITGWGEI